MANRAERRSKDYKQNKEFFQECVTETARILGKVFKDEPEKITMWMYTENPNFGGAAPAVFMNIRPEKYLKILKGLHDK